jgi:hypothetical protein
VGVGPSKFIKLVPWVTKLCYLHKHTMRVHNWRFSLSTAYCNAVYIQKSVSENAGIAVIGVEKYKTFLGEYSSRPPPPHYLNAILHQIFCYQQTYHLSTLGIIWSLGPFL